MFFLLVMFNVHYAIKSQLLKSSLNIYFFPSSLFPM